MEWTKQQNILRDLCSGRCSYIQFAPCAPSYLYAKYFASTLWERVCKEDPLSLETGTIIRKKLLQHGGSKDPTQLLNDLAGDGITRSYQNQGHGGGAEPTHMLLLLLYLILFDSLSTRHFKEMFMQNGLIDGHGGGLGSYPRPTAHPPSPSLTTQRLIHEQQPSCVSLRVICVADREKEATMEEERRKEEEARIKLEEEYRSRRRITQVSSPLFSASRSPPPVDHHLQSTSTHCIRRRSYTVHQAAATAYGALCAVLCSLLIGSNGRQNHVILRNLVDRFIGWALSLFSNINVGDGIVELAAEGLHEFLNVAEGLNADYFFGSSLAESSTYADLKVEVILDKSMKINNITDAKIEATLFDINTNEGSNLLSTNVASLELQQPPHFPLGFHGYRLEGKLKNPKLWSAEQLNLYTLVVTLKDASGNIIDCELCLSRQGGGYSRKIQMVANIGHMEGLLEGLEIAAKLLFKTSRQGLDELKISYFGMARSFGGNETQAKVNT
ncbi:unnamed protein product [Lactuca saligna]|uniref:beta-galactosidase n=1 Tax=Lactuca saligna TaxID=75948 RepID=A0AA35ZAY0_LACSI|nr:unnamed protein product [Lactuca saligna]